MAIRGGRGGGPGGGGRSHFGGSSRSSGGRSHSSGGSRGHIGGGPIMGMHHRGPRHGVGLHIHGGPMSGSSFLVTLSVFFIFITIMLGIGIGTTNSSLKTIERSYNNYQSMIEMAMENDDYVRYATVTGKYEGKNDRWYIEYTLKETFEYEYESFAIYSKEEINQFKIGDQIKIAVEDAKVDMFTDTIPFDYYNSPIENDAEYIGVKNSRRLLIFIAIGTGAVAVVLMIIGIKSSKSKTEEDTSSLDSTATPQKTTNTCKYCGHKVPVSQNKCPQCGATID